MSGGLVFILAAVIGHASATTVDEAAILQFAPGVAPAIAARELCLQHGCEVRQVYPYLRGAAVRGANLQSLTRDPLVVAWARDLPIAIDEDAEVLIGAPRMGPLVVIGGRFEGAPSARVQVWPHDDAPRSRPELMTKLLAEVGHESGRDFWNLVVLDEEGAGRLSDLLAAFEVLAPRRYAVSAVYVPLKLAGVTPPLMCGFLNDVLRRGALVVTGLGNDCSYETR